LNKSIGIPRKSVANEGFTLFTCVFFFLYALVLSDRLGKSSISSLWSWLRVSSITSSTLSPQNLERIFTLLRAAAECKEDFEAGTKIDLA